MKKNKLSKLPYQKIASNPAFDDIIEFLEHLRDNVSDVRELRIGENDSLKMRRGMDIYLEAIIDKLNKTRDNIIKEQKNKDLPEEDTYI